MVACQRCDISVNELFRRRSQRFEKIFEADPPDGETATRLKPLAASIDDARCQSAARRPHSPRIEATTDGEGARRQIVTDSSLGGEPPRGRVRTDFIDVFRTTKLRRHT